MVAQTGKPISTNMLREDVRFLRQAVVDTGFQCLACVPLMARGDDAPTAGFTYWDFEDLFKSNREESIGGGH